MLCETSPKSKIEENGAGWKASRPTAGTVNCAFWLANADGFCSRWIPFVTYRPEVLAGVMDEGRRCLLQKLGLDAITLELRDFVRPTFLETRWINSGALTL